MPDFFTGELCLIAALAPVLYLWSQEPPEGFCDRFFAHVIVAVFAVANIAGSWS